MHTYAYCLDNFACGIGIPTPIPRACSTCRCSLCRLCRATCRLTVRACSSTASPRSCCRPVTRLANANRHPSTQLLCLRSETNRPCCYVSDPKQTDPGVTREDYGFRFQHGDNYRCVCVGGVHVCLCVRDRGRACVSVCGRGRGRAWVSVCGVGGVHRCLCAVAFSSELASGSGV